MNTVTLNMGEPYHAHSRSSFHRNTVTRDTIPAPQESFLRSTEKPEQVMKKSPLITSLTSSDTAEILLGGVMGAGSGRLWEKEHEMAFFSNVVYDPRHRHIYTLEKEGESYVLACSDNMGNHLWKDPGFSPSTSPVVDKEGDIYLNQGGDTFKALDKDGHEKWRIDYQAPHWSDEFGRDNIAKYCDIPPVVGPDGTVYTLTGGPAAQVQKDGTIDYTTKNTRGWYIDDSVKITALKNGQKKWESLALSFGNRKANHLLVGNDGTVYAAAYKRVPNPNVVMRLLDRDWEKYHFLSHVIALNPDGTEKFAVRIKKHDGPVESWNSTTQEAMAEGADGTIFVLHSNYYIAGIKPDGLIRQPWDMEIKSEKEGDHLIFAGGPAADKEGNIYVALNSMTEDDYHMTLPGGGPGKKRGVLVKISPWGRELWRINTEERIVAKPRVDPDGNVFCATRDGLALAYDRTGKEVTRMVAGDRNPENGAVNSFVHGDFSIGEKGEIYGKTNNTLFSLPPVNAKQRAEFLMERREAALKEGSSVPDTSRDVNIENGYLIIDGMKLKQKELGMLRPRLSA